MITPVEPLLLQIISFGKGLIIPLMLTGFGLTLLFRAFIYYTIRREETFGKEFENRVHYLLEDAPIDPNRSFYVITKKILEKTFYELYEKRAIMKRHRLDYVVGPGDRMFMVQQGSARIVRDLLKEIKFLKFDGNTPAFLEVSKSVLGSNPYFNKVFGIFPVGPFNDMLAQIPGLFIVAGIFGTFLGIMQALPELGSMDIRDPESTKLVMDTFLAKIAFSMASSTIGILLSVVSTVYNNFVSPDKLYLRTVERFERCLFRIWLRCANNILPQDIPNFDENRDPIEALAEMAVDKELNPEGGLNEKSSGQPPHKKAA